MYWLRKMELINKVFVDAVMAFYDNQINQK